MMGNNSETIKEIKGSNEISLPEDPLERIHPSSSRLEKKTYKCLTSKSLFAHEFQKEKNSCH